MKNISKTHLSLRYSQPLLEQPYLMLKDMFILKYESRLPLYSVADMRILLI